MNQYGAGQQLGNSTTCGGNYSGYDMAAKEAECKAPAVKSGSFEEKLKVQEALLFGLHDSISGLESRLSDLLPEALPAVGDSIKPTPPSMSPIGSRMEVFNNTLSGAIARIERIKANLDL